MEQVAIRIQKTDGWTYVGGDAEAKKPIEVVIRAFEGNVLTAIGEGESTPTSEPVAVPEGEGRRLVGRHFFVRPAPPERACLISFRGM